MGTGTEPATGPQRRRFAAKYHYRRPGVALAIVGPLLVIGGLANAELSVGERIPSIIIGLILTALAVYLLRGQGENPAAAARRAAAFVQAKSALAAAGSGGAALVAYRNLEATVRRNHPDDHQAQLQQALASINFDPSTVASPQLGVIPALPAGTNVEVFRDWIIYGQEAHDVDASTRGEVFVDWSAPVANNQQPARTAQHQFVSSGWSMSVPIPSEQVNEARRVVAQLEANVSTLQPKGVTAADIRAMVDTILHNTGQPPAEKLKQLSNLRYDRLLSDDEFEQAKSKILGIG